MIKKVDRRNWFVAMFNPTTGFYARSGIIDENDHGTGVDPFMTTFPELIDVGMMGHRVHGTSGLCLKSGVQCYQNGLKTKEPNMTLENFKHTVNECKSKTFQLALSGRGDVDQHENFVEILQYCRENNIVPNFTSSGLGFTDETVDLCGRYCGAVAISWCRREHTYRAVWMLLGAGVKTNIHYVLGSNSVEETIMRLKNSGFPAGINAVTFLLRKPVGFGGKENVLQVDNPLVRQFFEVVGTQRFNFKIGLDSCSIPAVLNLTHNIDHGSIDTCENGRWSMYITSDMKALPCSFDNQELRWAFDINNAGIKEAWNSQQFESFRSHFEDSYPNCQCQHTCVDGYPTRPQVILYGKVKKELY